MAKMNKIDTLIGGYQRRIDYSWYVERRSAIECIKREATKARADTTEDIRKILGKCYHHKEIGHVEYCTLMSALKNYEELRKVKE